MAEDQLIDSAGFYLKAADLLTGPMTTVVTLQGVVTGPAYIALQGRCDSPDATIRVTNPRITAIKVDEVIRQ